MAESIIELTDLTVTVNGKTLLDGISLQIAAGEHVLLAGASGSGKSTLLDTLMGGYIPSGGTYRYAGTHVDHHTIGMARTRMAFIGQEPVLGAATVRDALLVPFTFKANHHLLPGRERIKEVLNAIRLGTDILEQPVDTVSGGEKQRLVIARALLLEKRVFLIDEATSALDPESKQAVLDVFKNHDATIISISHDTAWQALAGRTVTLANGKLAG